MVSGFDGILFCAIEPTARVQRLVVVIGQGRSSFCDKAFELSILWFHLLATDLKMEEFADSALGWIANHGPQERLVFGSITKESMGGKGGSVAKRLLQVSKSKDGDRRATLRAMRKEIPLVVLEPALYGFYRS